MILGKYILLKTDDQSKDYSFFQIALNSPTEDVVGREPKHTKPQFGLEEVGVMLLNFPLQGPEWREVQITPGKEESLIIQ